MKKLLLVLAILRLTTPLFAETYIIKPVIDGDTLELSGGEKVHLIGINIPKVDTKRAEAKDFVKSFLEGKEVRLEFDVRRETNPGGCWLMSLFPCIHIVIYHETGKKTYQTLTHGILLTAFHLIPTALWGYCPKCSMLT